MLPLCLWCLCGSNDKAPLGLGVGEAFEGFEATEDDGQRGENHLPPWEALAVVEVIFAALAYVAADVFGGKIAECGADAGGCHFIGLHGSSIS